jgi:hypothetical protein
MPSYDPKVIQVFAGDLYAKAASIVLSNTIVAGVVGAAIGGGGGMAVVGQNGPGGIALVAALIFGLLGAAMGYSAGQQKAASLRLQAQTALCQVAIEHNTRRPSGA